MEQVLCPITVGRRQERRRLEAALSAAVDGEARVVVLAGDAGLGKTRLASELARTAAGAGAAVLWGSCSEAELSLPYLPFLEAVGNHLTVADLPGLRQRLLTHRELGRLFPQLELEAPPPDPNDPFQGRLRLFEAVLGLLRLLSEPGGLLLVLENMHWADAASRELLDYLVRRLRGTRVAVLVTCRLERLGRRHPLLLLVDSWRRARIADLIELEPLSSEEVGEVLRATLSLEAVPSEICRLLHERSEGNPFALEEILKQALDRGLVSLAGVEARQLAEVRLPRSVQDSVLSRLEDLPEETAELLRCASVLGTSFDYALLESITGLDSRAVRAALRICTRQQLLEEDPQREGCYRFRHSLTREAIYADLLAPQREELHSLAAEALSAREGTPAVELCHHLLAARRDREAVPLALAAAEQAERAHAYGEAADLCERVLPLVSDPRQRAELLCRTGRVLWAQGNAARAERHLREGVRELERLGDSRAAAGQRIWLGRCHRDRSQPELAQSEFETARQRLEQEPPSEELAMAHVQLARLAVFQLDGNRAVELARRAAEVATAAGARAPRIEAHTYLGLGHIQLGRLEEGLEHLDLAHREAAAGGYDLVAAFALYNAVVVLVQHQRPLEAVARLEALKSLEAGELARLQALRADGFLHLWGLGQPVEAERAFRQALVLAGQGELQGHVNWLLTHLAVTLAELDRLEEARELLPDRLLAREGQDRATRLFAEMRIGLDSGRLEAALPAAEEVLAQAWPLRTRLYLSVAAAEALLEADRRADARRLLELAEQAGADRQHPYVLNLRGILALAEGAPAPAAQALRAAADSWRDSGARLWESRARLALARALAEGGQVEDARTELQEVLRSAQQRRAALMARLAREALSRLGSRVLRTEHVKEALEALHTPTELDRLPLGRLLGLAGDSGRLQRLLVETVEELASSSDGRVREAGQLLRDYYLRRLGSQELVAERLHLTRATFYRRLHLGWDLLGRRLTSRS